MREHQILISVVIVTWNRKQEVLAALRSIDEQDYHPVETIVVDNASVDGTVEAIREQFPGVHLIQLDRNLGVSSGRNPGFKAASGSIIFVLDSDATLEKNTLTSIADRFCDEPHLGIITCKFINGRTLKLDDITWIFSQHAKADADTEFICSTFCSAGVAIRKEVFDKVGFFWDQLYFKRAEDEFSIRVLNANYDILYYPRAIVFHHVSSHGRLGSAEREYYDLRNALFIYLVHFPVWMIVGFGSLKIATSLIRGIRHGYVTRDISALLSVAKDFSWLMQCRVPIEAETARRYCRLQRERGSLSWGVLSWILNKT